LKQVLVHRISTFKVGKLLKRDLAGWRMLLDGCKFEVAQHIFPSLSSEISRGSQVDDDVRDAWECSTQALLLLFIFWVNERNSPSEVAVGRTIFASFLSECLGGEGASTFVEDMKSVPSDVASICCAAGGSGELCDHMSLVFAVGDGSALNDWPNTAVDQLAKGFSNAPDCLALQNWMPIVIDALKDIVENYVDNTTFTRTLMCEGALQGPRKKLRIDTDLKREIYEAVASGKAHNPQALVRANNCISAKTAGNMPSEF
tara:strand:- start:855 stop:1631 length:777 start_codon:yes stop_codon:yes gene_type:complete